MLILNSRMEDLYDQWKLLLEEMNPCYPAR